MATTTSLTSSVTLPAVRASVSSGSRAPAYLANVSSSQLMSRLDALSLKAKNAELPRAKSAPADTIHEPFSSSLSATHFGECHARLQCWWKEHLEDKAALVHAACGEYTVEEEEETLFQRPVQVDWINDRYPVSAFGSRF